VSALGPRYEEAGCAHVDRSCYAPCTAPPRPRRCELAFGQFLDWTATVDIPEAIRLATTIDGSPVREVSAYYRTGSVCFWAASGVDGFLVGDSCASMVALPCSRRCHCRHRCVVLGASARALHPLRADRDRLPARSGRVSSEAHRQEPAEVGAAAAPPHPQPVPVPRRSRPDGLCRRPQRPLSPPPTRLAEPLGLLRTSLPAGPPLHNRPAPLPTPSAPTSAGA
jgi:hypothetical protein